MSVDIHIAHVGEGACTLVQFKSRVPSQLIGNKWINELRNALYCFNQNVIVFNRVSANEAYYCGIIGDNVCNYCL